MNFSRASYLFETQSTIYFQKVLYTSYCGIQKFLSSHNFVILIIYYFVNHPFKIIIDIVMNIKKILLTFAISEAARYFKTWT